MFKTRTGEFSPCRICSETSEFTLYQPRDGDSACEICNKWVCDKHFYRRWIYVQGLGNKEGKYIYICQTCWLNGAIQLNPKIPVIDLTV